MTKNIPMIVTKKVKLGFLGLFSFVILGLSACNKTGPARAEVTILEEYAATQGQLLQTRPLVGAQVHFYVPPAPNIEAIEFTDQDGKVFFEYKYEARVHVDVLIDNMVVERTVIHVEEGETTKKTLVVSQ